MNTIIDKSPEGPAAADTAVAWAVERWNAEVVNRPLQNVHRAALDTTWRQVIRYFGGDPDELLLLPPHYDMTNESRPALAAETITSLRARLVNETERGDKLAACLAIWDKDLEMVKSRLAEAAAELAKAREAYGAAARFIDAHVADPDITDEMANAYSEFLRARAALAPEGKTEADSNDDLAQHDANLERWKTERIHGSAPTRAEVLEALTRAERKLSAYVGVCKGDKELTDTVLPMVRRALAGEKS